MKEKVSATQRTLNVWAIVLILWCFYRSVFKTDLPIWFDEFIGKPFIFLFPLYIYITRFEKQNFFVGVDLKGKKILEDILIGLFLGLVFFSTGAFAYYIKFNSFIPAKIVDISVLGSFIAIAFASSFSEEILSRGFVLKRLFDESKNTVTSIFISSFLFFVLHVPMLLTSKQIIGTALIQVMVTDFVLSLAVSIMYLQRRNVMLPILIHAFYNLSLYLFI